MSHDRFVPAALILTKGYFVAVEAAPDAALAAGFTDWPTAAVPVFIAMMFGGTLGGSATLPTGGPGTLYFRPDPGDALSCAGSAFPGAGRRYRFALTNSTS